VRQVALRRIRLAVRVARVDAGAMKWLIALGSLGACTSIDVLDARKLPTGEVTDAAAVVAANNALACDLYAAVRSGAAPPTNFFLSPFSISTELAMLDAGAAGNTDAQLRAAMHSTLSTDATNGAYHALLASLATGTGYGGYSLDIANRLFGQQGFGFLSSFLATTDNDYGAALQPVDIASDPMAAVATVNSWVSDRTDGHIPMLLAPTDVTSTTRLVPVNAIAFQGAWDAAFDPAQPGPFTLASGDTVTAQLMENDGADPTQNAGDRIGTGALPGGQFAVLPFRGKDLSMIVLLPDAADGLPALEAQLTADTLASWLAEPLYVGDGVDLTLPKFGFATTIDLGRVLASLGVVDAFDPNTADFSGIDGKQDLFLDNAQHQATIAVDEQGATAEAATSSTPGVLLLPPSFTVDHPFLFLIHDEVTGAVLFIGRVGDPTQ
jgi:serine protease inhibitor